MLGQKDTVSEPHLRTIPQVAEVLGLSCTNMYELIWRKELPVVQFDQTIRYLFGLSILFSSRKNYCNGECQ